MSKNCQNKAFENEIQPYLEKNSDALTDTIIILKSRQSNHITVEGICR